MSDRLDKSGPLRRFTDASIQESVERALASLPQEAKGAVVAYAGERGPALAFVARPSGRWSIAVAVDAPKRKLAAEAMVVYAW